MRKSTQMRVVPQPMPPTQPPTGGDDPERRLGWLPQAALRRGCPGRPGLQRRLPARHHRGAQAWWRLYGAPRPDPAVRRRKARRLARRLRLSAVDQQQWRQSQPQPCRQPDGRRQPRSAGQSHRHLQGLAATILPGRQGLAAGRPLPDRQRVLHHRFIGRLPASVIRDGCRSRQLRQPGRAVDLSDEFLCGAPAYRPRSCVVRDGRGRAWNSQRADRDRRPQCQLAEGHRQHADR
jgi:hypothetical protein